MLDAAIEALITIAEPTRMLILFGGVILGLVVGVIPGLSGVVGLAILIPFTYGLDPFAAIALLIGMHAVTTNSDLIPAVLFGVPGTVGAAATVIDGHAMAKNGEAGRAFGAGYAASLIGGIAGALLLAAVIPVIRPFVLYMGSPELLAFSIFGLSMVAVLSGKAPLKGLAGAAIGVLIAMVGYTPQTGTMRWSFDLLYLWDGLPLVPITLGLFAVPELLDMVVKRSGIARDRKTVQLGISSQWVGFRDVLKNWPLTLRSSWMGALLGAIPGLGSASIDWIVYGQAQRSIKGQHKFGEGDVRGVIAPEAAVNAKEGGALIPTIAFGVPGGAGMAVLLSAFLLHGLVPGPEMLNENLSLTYTIIWSLVLANILATVICLSISGQFARLSLVSTGKLVPVVLSLMIVGAYQATSNIGDLYVLVISGIAGYVLKSYGWPRPPIILGVVLGAMLERYMLISVQIFGWEWLLRPVVIVVLAIAVWVVFKPLKQSLHDTIGQLRELKKNEMCVTPAAALSLCIIAALVVLLIEASNWPARAGLVPLTALWAGLVFCTLNLLTEVFASARTAPVDAVAGGVTPSAPRGTADIGSADQSNIEGDDIRTQRVRALRFIAWLVVYLGSTMVIGLLPSILVITFALTWIEFRERIQTAIIAAVAGTTFIWISFDQIFRVRWPQALLGDLLPSLRQILGLF